MHIKKAVFITLILLAFCSARCSSLLVFHPSAGGELPTPTLNPYFGNEGRTHDRTEQPSSTPVPSPILLSPTPGAHVATQVIYDDTLASGWSTQDSQGSQINLQSTQYAYIGTHSIAFTPEKDFGSLFLTVQASNSQKYFRSRVIGFSFWVYSDTDYIRTSDLAVTITGSNQIPYWIPGDTSVTNRYDPIFSETRLYDLGYNHDIPPKTWTQVDVILDDLIYDPIYQYVTGLMIKSDEGFRNTVYIDQVQLSILENLTNPPASTEVSPSITPAAISTRSDATATLTVQPASPQAMPEKHYPGVQVFLDVQTSAQGTPINEDIYGMNFADKDQLAQLGLSINRWGGNATTRYNWQTDTSNRASDWFFENIPNKNPAPEKLPDGSSSDQFVEENRAAGVDTILTIPLIGWTPRAREFACAFNTTLYGNQKSTDKWHPECGNGVAPNGKNITGNDPADTSLPIDETFVQDWIRHLDTRFGLAGQGGVRFYSLDNEPMLWNIVHRDVHPQAVGYDEIRDLTYRYAAALKVVDPGAQTLGPVVWGWTAYFYSALDQVNGGKWWDKAPDRKAHDNMPFLPWYLQQMQAYEQTHGLRILDYLDVHYYPQATGVALGKVGDENTQMLRLRSTRSLWDPSYKDESWIGEPVNLIPRLRDWIEQYYPGTKLAITEYNFGGLEDLNGALTQAEVLGIFGREGVDLATLWSPPKVDQPGAFAFRMYRNYDGSGSVFGDLSLPATSSDPDQLSIFAARDKTSGKLTLMLINKTDQTIKAQILFDNNLANPVAQVYQYNRTNLSGIQKLDDLKHIPDGWLYDFAAQSITLLVFDE
jgi:hypothetical protein